MKKIVTHLNPDLDAICGVWLLKRFAPGFSQAQVQFIPIGETLNGKLADSDPHLVHVDTGFGTFDHHQTAEYTSSAKRVLDSLPKLDEALKHLVAVVTEIDNGKDILWFETPKDRSEFYLDSILFALKSLSPNNHKMYLEFGMQALDAVYEALKRKIAAEKVIREKAVKFKTHWGEGIGAVTENEYFIALGQKQGYVVVLRKDPARGYIRIYSRPDSEVDLTEVYEKLKKLDPGATWYLHTSKKLLLNGSTSDPKMKPTKLGLEEVMKVLEG